MRIFTPDQKLLALSWKQPYAQLMLHGKIETRTWNTNYRGWVLICASKKGYFENQTIAISGEKQYRRIANHLWERNIHCFSPSGHAIAIGYLADCRQMTQADEDLCFVQCVPYETRYCHIYDSVVPIVPFAWKGSQGWKEVSEDIKKTIIRLR